MNLTVRANQKVRLMVRRLQVNQKSCFVLMPFRDPFNGYYQRIIKPLLTDLGLEVDRSDEIYTTRPIINDIWKSIWEARLVIADVTTKNPNVNYELGLCHAIGVPTILLSKTIDDVPFDYRHRRCIIYDTNDAGWEENLSKAIRRTVETRPRYPRRFTLADWWFDFTDTG